MYERPEMSPKQPLHDKVEHEVENLPNPARKCSEEACDCAKGDKLEVFLVKRKVLERHRSSVVQWTLPILVLASITSTYIT